MRIRQLLQLCVIALAVAGLFGNQVQAQDIPLPPPVGQTVTAPAEQNETADGIERPTRPSKTKLPTFEILQQPLYIVSGALKDGTKFTGLTAGDPGAFGYGNITSGPVKTARVFFSNSLRSVGGYLILRLRDTDGSLYFPLAVDFVPDGFRLYKLDPKVMVKNVISGEIYGEGRTIPYLGSDISAILDINFGEYLNPIQIAIQKVDDKSDQGMYFISVDEQRPEPPQRGEKVIQP